MTHGVAVVPNHAVGIGVLNKPGDVSGSEVPLRHGCDDDFHLHRRGPGHKVGDRLRVQSVVNPYSGSVGTLPVAADGHRHRLRRRRRLVKHGGVGDLHPRQLDDHRLKVDQRLEAALGNLSLVRRVLGVPAGVFEDVPLDNRRGDRVGVSMPIRLRIGVLCAAIARSRARS
jgi:hypothetical protein